MIVGQRDVIDGVIVCILAGGNVLLEGVPGLGKTMLVRSLATALGLDFSRIQFTPDLMPTDILGTTMLVESEDGKRHFTFEKGPIFANMILADEINRATPKTQSAMLEAMQEKSVTIGKQTYQLEQPFFVLATQNPLEQEGTYPLPEAQLDRFLMKVLIDYPAVADEVSVIRLVRSEEQAAQQPEQVANETIKVAQQAIFAARREIAALHVAEPVEQYIAELVNATRHPAALSPELERWIELGASPRASLALDRCGRAHAWLNGRDYLDPQDVQAVAPDVLRHRIGLSFAAQGEGVDTEAVIAQLLAVVALP